MLVTTLTPEGTVACDKDGQVNTYVIRQARFSALYKPAGQAAPEPGFGDIYEAKREVDAFATPGGFEIMTPWGEVERATTGYLVLNGEDVYGVEGELFKKTYTKTDV